VCPQSAAAVPVSIPAGIAVQASIPIPAGIAVPVSVPIPAGIAIPVSIPIPAGIAVPFSVPIPAGIAIPVSVPVPAGIALPVSTPIPAGIGVPVAVVPFTVVAVAIAKAIAVAAHIPGTVPISTSNAIFPISDAFIPTCAVDLAGAAVEDGIVAGVAVALRIGLPLRVREGRIRVRTCRVAARTGPAAYIAWSILPGRPEGRLASRSADAPPWIAIARQASSRRMDVDPDLAKRRTDPHNASAHGPRTTVGHSSSWSAALAPAGWTSLLARSGLNEATRRHCKRPHSGSARRSLLDRIEASGARQVKPRDATAGDARGLSRLYKRELSRTEIGYLDLTALDVDLGSPRRHRYLELRAFDDGGEKRRLDIEMLYIPLVDIQQNGAGLLQDRGAANLI